MSQLVIRKSRKRSPLLEQDPGLQEPSRTEPNWADLLLGRYPLREASSPSLKPALEIKETPTAFVIRIDVPGIPQENLEVSLVGNRLEITGTRTGKPLEEGEACHLREPAFGTFTRNIHLPEVDEDNLQADLFGGVLSIRVPKRAKTPVKKISISNVLLSPNVRI